MSVLRDIPIDQIIEATKKLREVNQESEEFLGMVESIAKDGLMNAISVRPVEVKGKKLFSVVDGSHRFLACKAAGKTVIPAQVLDIDESRLDEAQIIANVHKIETKPAEYSRALSRILDNNPTMTLTELGNRLSRSYTWLRERLSLNNLTEDAGALVDAGQIPLISAYALSKLDESEQANWLDRAQSMPSGEFVGQAQQRLKEIRASKREGRNKEDADKFVPTPRLRKLTELLAELDDTSENSMAHRLVTENKIKSPIEAFRMAVKWGANLDPESLAVAEAKHNQHIADRDAKRAAAAEERKRKKLEEAKDKAKGLEQELAASS